MSDKMGDVFHEKISKECSYFGMTMRTLRISSDLESRSKVAFICPRWILPNIRLFFERGDTKRTSPRKKN